MSNFEIILKGAIAGNMFGCAIAIKIRAEEQFFIYMLLMAITYSILTMYQIYKKEEG